MASFSHASGMSNVNKSNGSSPTSSISMTNIVSLILIKSDDTNYILWRALFKPILNSSRIMDHINGNSLMPNHDSPNFVEWFEKDQILIT
jgi:hypothetical protein